MDASNTLWTKVREGIEAFGDMLVSAFDQVMTAASCKFRELAGNAGTSLSNGMSNMKSSISNAIAPNTIGKAKTDVSPSQGQALSQKKEVAAPSAPSQDMGAMLQSAGFSMEAMNSAGVQATDLGQGASVGVDGVGCAAYDVPRAAVTQVQQLVR